MPTPPDHLSAEALAEWHRVAPGLHSAGLLTALDRGVLAAYCQSFARWQEAEAILATSGLTIVSPRGNKLAHPLVAVARRSAADMLRVANELGLTPASRGRIAAVPPAPEGDPGDKYFD